MWLSLLRWIGAHRMALMAGAVVLVLGAAAWGLWRVHQTGYAAGVASVQARWDASAREAEKRARAEERLVQRAVDAIGARLTADLARIRIEHKTINRRIVDEVRSVPLYGECRLGQRVWDDLNTLRAATDTGTAGRGGDAVSGAAAPW